MAGAFSCELPGPEMAIMPAASTSPIYVGAISPLSSLKKR